MRIIIAGIFLGLAGTMLALPLGSRAQTMVDCDAGETIGAALETLRSGETLLVSGTCHENVLIRAAMTSVTLDGQGRATIETPDTAAAILLILGREITVRGFTLSGGRNGINVLRGASATIDGNTIRGTGRGGQPGSGLGINVGQHAFAAVVNNTIENNARIGILVHENSSARIGFVDVALTGGVSNTIRNNGEDGISIARSSNARIVGSTIMNNAGNGILVERGSQAEISDNLISGNAKSAILAIGGSGIDIDNLGASTAIVSNRTDAAQPNGGYGVQCIGGGYVMGTIGTLSGSAGVTQFDATCADAVQR